MFPSADTTYLSASALTAAPSVMPLDALRVTLFPLTGAVVTLMVPLSPVALTSTSPRAVAVPASMPWISMALALTIRTDLPAVAADALTFVSSLFALESRMSPVVEVTSANPATLARPSCVRFPAVVMVASLATARWFWLFGYVEFPMTRPLPAFLSVRFFVVPRTFAISFALPERSTSMPAFKRLSSWTTIFPDSPWLAPRWRKISVATISPPV